MRFAVSIALLVLLLGMPLACVFASCQLPAPCCPRTKASFKCPYDALDSAKITSIVAIANVPVSPAAGFAPAAIHVESRPSPTIAKDSGDLYILNRILRI